MHESHALPYLGMRAKPARRGAPEPSLASDVVAAFRRHRQRRVERSIGAFIQRRGGAFTDAVEREVIELLTGAGGRLF